MKKKFILLAMMLLTLIGGVKFNVLNAQEVEIGVSDNSPTGLYPMYTSWSYSETQQIYTESEIGQTGRITEIAFKTSTGNKDHNITVWMLTTSQENLSTAVSYADTDIVFNGVWEVSKAEVNEWAPIVLTEPFEYNGGNLVVVMRENGTGGTEKFHKYTKSIGTSLYYKYASSASNLLTNSYTGSTNNNLFRIAFEPVDDIVPAAPTNLVATAIDHQSISLAWTAGDENALKYNIYQGGVNIGSTTQTSYTVEGLTAETNYCFTVEAVRGVNVSESHSNEACAITGVAPKTQKIVFTLNDTYGDGWVANSYSTSYHTLTIKVNGEELKNLTINNGKTYTETLEINEGASVAVIFNNGGSWSNECSYKIEYDDGEVITSELSGLSGGHTYTFVVRTSDPKVTVAASAYDIYSDQTATLTATAANFDGDVAYSWSPAENLSDASISNPVFTPTSTGSFEFTCTVTDANNNEASASVTINVTERPALALDVTADKTEIYQGQNTMLNADASGGFPDYSFNWFLNGEEYGTGSSFYFAQTEVGEYTITCKVTDANGGTIEKSVTVSVLANPFAGKQFRVKVMDGSYAGQYLNVNSHDIVTSPGYWSQDASTRVGVSQYQESNSQKFTIEMYDSQRFYLRDADGYLIKCDDQISNYGRNTWDVDAYSTTVGTPLWFDYVDGEQFYIRDYDKYLGNGSTDNYSTTKNYFKVQDGLVYCDAPIDKNDGENHRVVLWSLEEVLPAVENLVANPTKLYPGETTILTWDAFDGATSYNIYVNGELKYNTTEIPYELSGLTYNVDGNTIEVFAVDENNVEISGKASVTVQVAGTFTLTVNVTDGTKPIEGATVNIDMAYAYDEFKNQISPVTVEPTGADGKTTVELLRLPNEGFYNDNGNWVYPFYTVEVSESPYQKQEDYINPGDVVTNGHTMDFVLALPKVSYIQVQDEEGEYLYGDVMEGTNVVLSWVAVEGADAYKVSKLVNDEVESSETITETTYTIEGVLKGYQYAVSALFGELESVKTTANIDVKGNGYFKGYVTDGTNALQGIQVKVSSEYGDASAVATTDAEGYFNGEIVEGDNYILTISHSDYEEFTSETFAIGYEAEYEFETITLTAKPSASDITGVTATLNGENVDVEWTVNETSTYTKYNVYRRLAGTQGKGDKIATEVTTTSTTDAAWETLEPGTYEYGVAALVEPQAQTRGTEVIFEEGFETTEINQVPAGWNKISGNWRVTNYSNSGGVLSGSQHLWTQYMEKGDHYLVMPAIAPAGATLSFVYRSAPWNGTYDDLTICYSTSQNGPWTKINDEVYRETSKTQVSIPLDNIEASTVYIAFCMTARYADGIYIDDVLVTREKASLVETQIVWSDEVVKQGPNTFEGTVSTDWNVAENWSHGNVPATGDEVIVNAEAVISGNVELSTLDIVGNGSVTVDANASLTVTGAITQEQDYSLIMNDGAQVFQNNANVKAQFNMNLVKQTSNKDGWQFISSPLSNVSVTNIAEGNYDLYKYEGDAELEWLNHKDENFADATYQHHIGYLASHETMSKLEFKGTLNYNDGDYGYYSFYDYVEYYKNEPLKNFYLIGNPYPFNISWADFKNNKGMVNGYAYVKEDGNYGYATSGEIAVGDGFFVQAISGTPDDPYSTYYYYLKGSGNTRSTKESNNSLNITATGNAGEDNVIINLAGKSEGFDKLQNFNDAIATVYVAEDGKNYGIYNCDADVQEVELSFNANKMGNYTISIEPNGKFQTVTLVDRFTGVETNMLVEDYNFTAMSSDNHNRFIVRFANGQQTTDNSHFVYQSGEELILNIQGDVQIVDVLGRVVYNGEAMNDINRINVSSFNSGAYMVKVMNGNEVKVEKVVIY